MDVRCPPCTLQIFSKCFRVPYFPFFGGKKSPNFENRKLSKCFCHISTWILVWGGGAFFKAVFHFFGQVLEACMQTTFLWEIVFGLFDRKFCHVKTHDQEWFLGPKF
jgi:hypothetical protein